MKSSNMSGMEDAEIERVLREYDVFQAAKAGLLIPCQGMIDILPSFFLFLEGKITWNVMFLSRKNQIMLQ